MTAVLALALAISGAPNDTLLFRGSAGELAVRAPFIETPAVSIDGHLDENAWARAALLIGFTQFEPVEGIPSTEETEVRVFYAGDAIYFAIRAQDSRPDQIRATLGERDRAIWGDDWVRLMLDTFNDRRQAYIFYVNPLGVQVDGFWIEGLERGRGGGGVGRSPVDFNPDFIWESQGRLTESGWVAEIRIPYVSLRFPQSEVQDWGFNVAREVRRTGYKQSWAPLTSNNPSTLEQSGALVGLQGLRPRRLMEVNPVLTGKRIGGLGDADVFGHDPFQSEFGLNARYGLTRNLVMDATFNPDFSQVEADADQITVNERFAIFFPEKRPFFLEGAEVFNTPQRLVYTRAVVDPIGGAKLTGKIGSLNVGYFGAVDESPVTFEEAGDNALFNVVRLRQDIGTGSTIGAVFADRTLLDGSGFNRVAGADARLRFGHYTLTTQLAGSWTAEGIESVLPGGVAFDRGPTEFGPIIHLQLDQASRTLNWGFRFEDVDPEFRAESGFIRRIGDVRSFAQVSYNVWGRPGAILERWTPRLQVEGFFDHDEFWAGNRPEEFEIQAQTSFTIRGNHSITVLVRDGYFAFQPQDFARYEVRLPDGTDVPFSVPGPLDHMRALALIGRSQTARWLSLNGRLYLREVPIYSEASRGFEIQAAPSATLKPTAGLSISLNYSLSRLWRDGGEQLFSETQIPRLRVQYQFSRAFFARVIGEYKLETRDALRDPSSGFTLVRYGSLSRPVADGDFRLEFLASYEPSPGTVVYAGWTRLMVGPDEYRFGDLEPVSEGLFLKVSYLFRL